MRRFSLKKLFAALTALVLTLSLTACGGGGLTTQDASDYLQGLLDATYLGQFSETYLESVDLTEAEARESYEKGLDVAYRYLAKNFQFSEEYVSEDTRQAATDLLAEIYTHARYRVDTATKTDKGFTLELSIQPIDLIPLVVEKYMEDYSNAFAAKYADTTQADVAAMPAGEAEAFWTAYENDWAMGIVELLNTHMNELDHQQPVSLLVQLTADEDGYYTIPDTDFANLDYLILAYTAE